MAFFFAYNSKNETKSKDCNTFNILFGYLVTTNLVISSVIVYASSLRLNDTTSQQGATSITIMQRQQNDGALSTLSAPKRFPINMMQ